VPIMTCPSQDDLLAFHLGNLPETQLDALGDHLETCLDCQGRVQKLDGASDPVLAVLGGTGDSTTTICSGQQETEGFPDLLAAPTGPDEIGRFGEYRVRRLLGRGGMGFVFAAEDTRLGREVALKVMRPGLAAEPEARQRFLREARAMASLGASPHIVPIYHVDENKGVPFLAMELLQGEPLDRWLAQHGRLDAAEIIRIGQGIAEGLAVAHARGLVHRDIKPANLWVQSPGDTLKVLDFGLARPAAPDVTLTRTGVIAGTPAYLSPEQAQDQDLDARADLFSLGCVLYEMCARRLPFEGRTAFALMTAVTTLEPTHLHKLRPDLPRPLVDLVMQLLAKHPAERPPSAQAVIDRLAAIDLTPPSSRRSRRRLVAGLLAAVAAVVLLAGTVIQIRTSKGLVEIRTDDPKIKVMVEQDGELITILDPESKQKIELRAGEYQVKMLPDNPDFKLSTSSFTLRRGVTEVLTVRRLDNIPKAADDAWVAKVIVLKGKEKLAAVTERLRKLNPDFKTEVAPKFVDDEVRELELSTQHIRDLSPVRVLTGLRVLVCWGGEGKRSPFSELSQLRGLKLTRLDCSNTSVSDLAPLVGMPLNELICRETLVADLAPLKGMPLTTLVCYASRVSTLAPLAGLPLAWLNCARNTNITDLTPLKGMPLTALMCDFTSVKDLSPLQGMPLNLLNVGVTPVRDLTPLKDMPLTLVGIGGCPVADLTPLKGMKLVTLWANDTEVADLSPLAGMPLETLWTSSSKVTKLPPLEGMKLKSVSFDSHPDIDLKLLRAMPNLKTINGEDAAEFWRKHDAKAKK
jgi:eukaryotic-like serine/threonine-protein kinase